MVFSPNDGNLYVAGASFQFSNQVTVGDIKRFDANTGGYLGIFISDGNETACALCSPPVPGNNRPLGKASDLAFSPYDGDLYVTDSAQNAVLHYDGRTGVFLNQFGVVPPITQPGGGPTALAFGADGNLYVSSSDQGYVVRLDAVTGASKPPLNTGFGSNLLAFQPQGTPVLVDVQGGISEVDSAGAPAANPTYPVKVSAIPQDPSGNFFCNPIAALLTPGIAVQCPVTQTDSIGSYMLSLPAPGIYQITAWPPQGSGLFPNSVLLNVPIDASRTGYGVIDQNITLAPPTPPPAGTSITPSSPSQGVPVVLWSDPLALTTQGCAPGTATYSMAYTTGKVVAHGTMTGSGPTYTASLPPFRSPGSATGVKGALKVTINIQCTGAQPETINFLMYVDPSGTVVDNMTGQPIPGATVTLFRSDTRNGTFTQVPLGSAIMAPSNRNNPDRTNANGQYGWDVIPGFYYLQASAPGYTCNAAGLSRGLTCVGNAVQSASFSIPPAALDVNLPLHFVGHPTSLTYTGATTGEFHDPVTLAATLMDTTLSPGAPVSGASLTLSVGSLSCVATTDATGRGSCKLNPNQPAGSYPLTASFAGTSQYLASAASASFTVTAEETNLEITSSATLPLSGVVAMARLLENEKTPIGGRTVSFHAGGLTASGTTDAKGIAKATLALGPGEYKISADFAGDADYRASAVEARTLFVFEPTQFVIWGGNPSIRPDHWANVGTGKDYTFWGANWSKQVTGGEFPANSGFKGYADSVAGAAWSANTGNSGRPPATVASYIGVIVSTMATTNGGVTRGNIAEIAVLRVDNPTAYLPDPGHPGTGVLVAIVREPDDEGGRNDSRYSGLP